MDSYTDKLSWLLGEAQKQGARAGDAVLFETVDLSQSWRKGKPEGLERAENKAVGLRAFVGDSQAIASSTDMSKEALGELAARVVAMAKAAPPDPDSTLAPPSLYPRTVPALDLCDHGEPSSEWLREQCRKAEDAALATPGITNSEGADAHFSRSHIALAVAEGGRVNFAQSYETTHASISVSVLAGEGVAMERDWDFTSAHHLSDLSDASAIGQGAAKRAVARLHPRKVKTCQVPIVFDPRVGKSLLASFASAISGSAVARGASFLKDAMGQPVFSPSVTIIDNPHLPRGLGSKPFDGEAVGGKKQALVERGVLKSWLLDMRSANKLKLAPTGHAARGLASAPSPSSSNLYMEKGTRSPGELLRDIKTGFYVCETFGMGVNTVTGDYSQGASGFWIENGELAYPVSEITIAGHLRDMFGKLVAANDLEFRYATNTPTFCIESMTVAGT